MISLSNLDVGKGVVTVQELLDSQDVTLLLTSLPSTTLVHSAAAVIGLSNSSQLINVGNSVEFCVVPDEVKLLVFVTKTKHMFTFRNIFPLLVDFGVWLPVLTLEMCQATVCYNSLNPLTHLKLIFLMSTNVHYTSLLMSFIVSHLSVLESLFHFFMNVVPHVPLGMLQLSHKWKGRQ